MGPEQTAVAFAVALRRAGVGVPTSAVAAYAEALAAVGVASGSVPGSGAYWAGRATLVRSAADRDRYDETFAFFFGGVRPPADPTSRTLPAVDLAHPGAEAESDDGASGSTAGAGTAGTDGSDERIEAAEPESDDDGADEADADDAGESDDPLVVAASRLEILSRRDFASCTDAERRELDSLIDRMRLDAPMRRGRRRRPATGAHRHGRPIHLRATARRALRTGEVVALTDARRVERARRVVLLCDVSGSMAPYSRALLRFLHAAVTGGTRAEAFALGTRLTRLTPHLEARDPDTALAAVARAVHDWSGGTRLGDTLAEFVDGPGVRGLARGAVVVILSDGWDRGDPRVLGRAVERLSRVAHRVVWVNPLKAGPGYEPLARGMAAALPHVDEFVEGHSLRSLADLAALVAGPVPARPHVSR